MRRGHGAPKRQVGMRVLFLGEPDDGVTVSSHHARALGALGVHVSFDHAGTDLATPQSSSPRSPDPQTVEDGAVLRPDLIHLVTFEQLNNTLLRRLVAARMGGTQIVRYWTGRDAVWAVHHEASRDFARALTRLGAVQLCRSPDIAAMLADIGVGATPIPIVSSHLSTSSAPFPLPQCFTVLSYLPAGRFEFHGGRIVVALAGRLPFVRFLILGGGGDELARRQNVECLQPGSDLLRALRRTTAVIDPRLDLGLSRLVVEAMCHGRAAITGCPTPYAMKANTEQDYYRAIRRLRSNPAFNLEGRTHVAREFDPPSAIRRLRDELENAIEPGRLNLLIEGGVRSAAAAMQNLRLLGPRSFPLPELDQLPPGAAAARSLLLDVASERWVPCEST